LPIDGEQALSARILPEHLKRLEPESIGVMREVAAEFRNPVLLYSIGKDSSVMLHLARAVGFGSWSTSDRLPLEPGERPQLRRARFRTLGCYPLTGAVESTAATPGQIVAELRNARHSERQGRLIATATRKL
jgi:3'-phosphoadenosine 5'-phosphosulfate sulfotransferase (PAPS reductase)/FAD synthetase